MVSQAMTNIEFSNFKINFEQGLNVRISQLPGNNYMLKNKTPRKFEFS